jgi:hypothetical protein
MMGHLSETIPDYRLSAFSIQGLQAAAETGVCAVQGTNQPIIESIERKTVLSL